MSKVVKCLVGKTEGEKLKVFNTAIKKALAKLISLKHRADNLTYDTNTQCNSHEELSHKKEALQAISDVFVAVKDGKQVAKKATLRVETVNEICALVEIAIEAMVTAQRAVLNMTPCDSSDTCSDFSLDSTDSE